MSKTCIPCLFLLSCGLALGTDVVDDSFLCATCDGVSPGTKSNQEGLEFLQTSSARIRSSNAATTSVCKGGWPAFRSRAELQADPWGRYFSSIYGEVPNFGFPLCVGDFWMFYDEFLSRAGVANIPRSVGKCPTAGYSRYNQNNRLSPPGVSWSWHPGPYKGWPSDSWVEVIHQQNPYGEAETKGGWMFFAKGSGMWFNLGKTIIFPDEDEALRHFNASFWPDVSAIAMDQGFQSMQIVGRDSGSGAFYPDCGHGMVNSALNVEIVAFKAHGQASCMAEKGTFPDIRVGWQGCRGSCNCDTSRPHLNCKKYTP